MTTYAELETLHASRMQAAEAVAAAKVTLAGAAPRDVRTAARAQLQLRRAQRDLARASAALDVALDAAVGNLNPGIPLLLLPVRLETRYDLTGATPRLRVRIYPDDIHLDEHEPELTTAEADAGRTYWTTCWDAEVPDRRRAWSALVRATGVQRAAWIAATMHPTNRRADGPPSFPEPALRAGRWTRPALAQMLPDCWRAEAWRGRTRIAAATSGLVRRPLAAGLDPKADEPGAPEMAWMTRFQEALNAGMALVMDLPDTDPIDLLTVIGVRGTEPAYADADTLANLLTAHRYGTGLSMVAPGAPTNNTETQRAALGESDPTGLARFVDPFDPPPSPIWGDGSDADLLGEALSFPPDILAGAPNSTQASVALERDMATVLWPATWGYYLQQMLRLDEFDAGGPSWRRWVIDHVRGGGPLPVLRSGRQPYGVLPITVTSRWRPVIGSGAAGVVSVELVDTAAGTTETHVRVFAGMNERAAWTFAGPQNLTVPTPPRATQVAAAAGDLDGDGLPELFLLYALAPTDPTQPGTLFGVTARLREYGIETLSAGETFAGPLPLATVATGQLQGLAVAIGQVSKEGPPDFVIVFQYAAAAGVVTTNLVVGTNQGTENTDWSDPVDISGQFGPGEVVISAAVLARHDGRCDLIVVTEDAQAPLDMPPARWHAGLTLTSDGSTGGWSESVPVGSLRSADIASAGAAIAVADVGDRPHALLGQYWRMPDGSASASYTVGQDPVDGVFTWPQGWFANLGQPVAPGQGRLRSGAMCWLPWTPYADPNLGLSTPATRVNTLRRLREIWIDAAEEAAHVRPDDENPDRTLLDLLATDAVSTNCDSRAFIGTQVLANTWYALDQPPTTDTASSAGGVEMMLNNLGIRASRPTRLATGAYTAAATPFTDPITGGDPDKAPLWLAEMAEATPAELHAGWIGEGTPLLARLVRHSLLQAYADAAFELAAVKGDPPSPLGEPELVDLPDLTRPTTDPKSVPTQTSWRHLSRDTYHDGQPLADVVYKLARSDNPPPRVQQLADTLAALRRVVDQPAGLLDRVTANVLDVAGHRLDAWITGVATQRLRELRARNSKGVHAGGFGFVCDLARSTRPLSTGYVHAPSMAHATTAAVLRSGHLTHPEGQLAVDLSSRRVRAALAVLAVVQEGQSLGAALGYRFERELYKHGIAQYLAAVRQLVPLDVGVLTPTPDGAAVNTVASMVTTDGLALLALVEAGGLPWGTTPAGQDQPLPAAGTNDQGGMIRALDALTEVADAIANVGLAESVHSLVLRNPVRAAATLDALTRGEAPPSPDADVLRTPRRGTGVSHRLLAGTPAPEEPAAAAALAAWPATAAQRAQHARAAAEPRLNAWAAMVLGDPARVLVRVARLDTDTRAPVGDPFEFTLAEVGLCPYDILGASPPSVVSLSETNLGRRLLRHAEAALGHQAGVALALLPARAGDWPPETLAVDDLLTLAASARVLVAAARPAHAGDLSADSGPSVDEAELSARGTACRAGLEAALAALGPFFQLRTDEQRAALAALFPGPDSAVDSLLDLPLFLDVGPAATAVSLPDPPDSAALAAVLGWLAGYGIPDAAVRPRSGDVESDRSALAVQARAAARIATDRLAAAADAENDASALEALFGDSFRALPVFANPAAPDLTPEGATTQEVDIWFDAIAPVREGAARLQEVLLGSEILGGAAAQWDVTQIADPAVGRWVALPPDPEPAQTRIPAGCVSIATATTTPTWREQTTLAGLAVDAWVETVPETSETTAVTFHLDSPDACAPQALLLAVSPDPALPWTWEVLTDVVREAAELARLRAIDPDLVQVVGHLLPALMLAHNVNGDPAGDTVSTVIGGA